MPPNIGAANLGSVPVALAPHENHYATAVSAHRQHAAERASFQGFVAVDGFDGGGGGEGEGNGIALPYSPAHSESTYSLHEPKRGWVFCT